MFLMIVIAVHLGHADNVQVLDRYPSSEKCEAQVPATKRKLTVPADVFCIQTNRYARY